MSANPSEMLKPVLSIVQVLSKDSWPAYYLIERDLSRFHRSEYSTEDYFRDMDLFSCSSTLEPIEIFRDVIPRYAKVHFVEIIYDYDTA